MLAFHWSARKPKGIEGRSAVHNFDFSRTRPTLLRLGRQRMIAAYGLEAEIAMPL